MVGSMPCGVRSRRRTPIAASRCEIDSDTADWDIARCDAAFAMLPQRTTVDRMWRSRSVTRRPIRFSQSVVRAIGITDRAKAYSRFPIGIVSSTLQPVLSETDARRQYIVFRGCLLRV